MSTYEDDGVVQLEDTAAQVVVAVSIVMVFGLIITEICSPEVAFLYALMAVTMTGILTLKEAVAGFSNLSLVTIGALYLVIAGVEKSYVVDHIARAAFGSSANHRIGSLRMFFSMFALSSVFNNTPLVAVMIPVVRDWGRVRGIALSQLLMPMSFAVLAGGLLTMIGTSTNLTVQGLVKDDRDFQFPFFSPVYTGLPCGIIMILYMVLTSPYLLPSRSGLIRELRDHAADLVIELEVLDSSTFKGKELGDVFNSLGISFSDILKVRRPLAHFHTEASTVKVSAKDVPTGSAEINLGNIELTEVVASLTDHDEAVLGSETVNISDAKYVERTNAAWGGPVEYEPVVKAETHDVEAGGAYRDILNPTPFEVIHEGDILFVTNAKELLTKLMKTIFDEKNGLRILESRVADIAGFGTDFAEVVLSHKNPFIGSNLSACLPAFNEMYNVSVVSSRQRVPMSADPTADETVKAEDAENMIPESVCDARSMVLATGDVLLCLTKDKNLESLKRNKDFYVVTAVGSVPKPLTVYGLIPLLVFLIMISAAASETIDMAAASLCTAAIFFAGGWVKAEEIPDLVDLRLLMLMGCSISFAKSMETSGLAAEFAALIVEVHAGSTGSLFIVYLMTLLMTELVSNNAAAALMYPFAVAVADELGVSYKPFVYVVMMSATAAFMSPIGYQTHVMVWGPGGYTFMDFVKFGFFPDIIYCVGTCCLVPLFYPF